MTLSHDLSIFSFRLTLPTLRNVPAETLLFFLDLSPDGLSFFFGAVSSSFFFSCLHSLSRQSEFLFSTVFPLLLSLPDGSSLSLLSFYRFFFSLSDTIPHLDRGLEDGLSIRLQSNLNVSKHLNAHVPFLVCIYKGIATCFSSRIASALSGAHCKALHSG